VTLTDAGARLLHDLAPALALLDSAVTAVGIPEGAPEGLVRLAAPRLAVQLLVTPIVVQLAQTYPHITLDVRTVEHPGDLVEGFDLGIQLGGGVARDMVAVALTGPFTTAVVGAPIYFRDNPPPLHPADLSRHRCIGCRSGRGGSLYRWSFEYAGENKVVDVDGPLIADDADLMLQSALGGIGLWHGIDLIAQPLIDEGRLLRVLADWSPTFPGFYLYYSGGAPLSPAVRVVVNMLRGKGGVARTPDLNPNDR
jgi:DNA-binding transcriptional LysR family regulator